MQHQMDVTGGLNPGGAQTGPMLQHQLPPAPPAPGIHTQPHAAQRPPEALLHGQSWQPPSGAYNDPRMYQQAIDDAMAAQAAMQAELQQPFPPMPAPGFDPYYPPFHDQYPDLHRPPYPDPYRTPFPDPYYDPRQDVRHDGMPGYGEALYNQPITNQLDPDAQARMQYEAMERGLHGMVDSAVADGVRQAQAQSQALDAFFGDYPALAGARNQISHLVNRGVGMQEILQMLVALNPAGSTQQSPPSPELRRQLRNETFVETGAADPYVDPISQDDDRMIRAAAKQLFNG